MITTPLPRFALASIRITVAAFAARQITEEEMPAPEKCAIEHCLINARANRTCDVQIRRRSRPSE
jgi:hypothetical protein